MFKKAKSLIRSRLIPDETENLALAPPKRQSLVNNRVYYEERVANVQSVIVTTYKTIIRSGIVVSEKRVSETNVEKVGWFKKEERTEHWYELVIKQDRSPLEFLSSDVYIVRREEDVFIDEETKRDIEKTTKKQSRYLKKDRRLD